MQIEIFGFCSLAIFAIIVYAETGKRKVLGVVAAFLLLILALATYTDGVQLPVGQNITTNSTQQMFYNFTTNETSINTTLDQTIVTNYVDVTVPGIDFDTVFTLTAVLFAMYMILYYVFR